jgi:hypothetical protein
MAQARFDNYKNQALNIFQHISQENQLSMLRNHVQKRRLSVKRK